MDPRFRNPPKDKNGEPLFKFKFEPIKHSNKEDFLSFRIEGVTLPFVNALRRIIYAEVPSLAIELVEFSENKSPLTEEFIAHRLGLIPLAYTEDKLVNHSDCHCGGSCPNCEILFSLDVTCDTEEHLVVRADSLSTDHAEFAPVHQEHPIVLFKLAKNQSVSLQATARRGTGKDHAKWCPVSNATFKIEPEITLNQESLLTVSSDDRQALVSSCPTNVFELDESTRTIKIADADACTYCAECLDLSQQLAQQYEIPRPIRIKESDPPKFVFTIEGTGSVPVGSIYKQATEILKKRLASLKSNWNALRDQQNQVDVS
ncbi:hypothetical protein P9112_012485 [Eukaryota sp. TZLM1-RC]